MGVQRMRSALLAQQGKKLANIATQRILQRKVAQSEQERRAKEARDVDQGVREAREFALQRQVETHLSAWMLRGGVACAASVEQNRSRSRSY